MTQTTFEQAHARVGALVADFRRHEAHYLSAKYSEQDVRKDFIDKFWIALGWDVNHETQKNPNEQEVKVERTVGVEGRAKRADYAFLTPNFRDVRFFVEAKKPARNIDNADDYFQTIRYGWNAQAAVSVLTDFEGFRVLDCRLKPDVDTARARVLKEFHYEDYADAEKFAEIYYLFSREAAHTGALEKYAAALPKPTGKAVNRKLFKEAFKTVDENFLQELDELREELARSFKNRNAGLGGEELTEATQRTLDRLVFMRFLEDKLIEPEVMVEKFGDGGSAWGDFVAQSERLNRIYNGIIFKPHFIDRADFVVDEKVFASARERLAHTNTVYNFNYIPIHVLGSIYERFLGKVIVATDKRARVEEKPEVRKAGGVYYTPEYIVRYIVAETVGNLIAGRKPAEIAELRFADIACGSGSFLLGVFDELLRHHTAYYNRTKTNRAEGVRAGCVENADGSVRLSLKQKRAILTRNIYGVDLDAQAVEVAQLSLFLKLLEDETTASARGHQLEFRETMLPDLSKNIRHGNSLIGWDIAGGLFGDEEERKLYPMDFDAAFPEVMRRGGFDAIVGNPPYLAGREWDDTLRKQRSYFMQHYNCMTDQYDLYALFIQRALETVKVGGCFGYITPTSWLNNEHYIRLRRWLVQQGNINLLADFRDINVFESATVLPVVIVLTRSVPDINHQTAVHQFSNTTDYRSISTSVSVWEQFPDLIFNLSLSERDVPILKKMQNMSKPVAEFADVRFGVKVYQKGKGRPPQTGEEAEGKIYESSIKESDDYHPYLRGKYVTRWHIDTKVAWLKYGLHLAEPRTFELFKGQRILVRRIVGERLIAAPTDETLIADQLLHTVKLNDTAPDYRYAAALLGSLLVAYYFQKRFNRTEKTFPEIRVGELAQLPIRTINFSDKADRARHDRMVSLVEAMLDAKRKLQAARSDRDRDHYAAKCAALDRQIDNLVYELYELTPEEIAIVEGVSA